MILEQLRVHTAAAHRALEDEIRIEDAVRSTEEYRRLLERFYGFHQPFEGRIRLLPGWEQTTYNPQLRLKSPWLEQDLAALGLTTFDIRSLPACTLLPDMRTVAQGFGCAYVIEGSTLGGRHIARLLEDCPAEKLPKRFFQSYGPEIGSRWKTFCAGLEEFSSEHPHAHPEIIRAAEETFACFQNWMR